MPWVINERDGYQAMDRFVHNTMCNAGQKDIEVAVCTRPDLQHMVCQCIPDASMRAHHIHPTHVWNEGPKLGIHALMLKRSECV